MVLSASGIRARFDTELVARGIAPTEVGAAPWTGTFLDALADSFVGAWTASTTLPGNGPIIPPPPTQPHTHTPLPGSITGPGLVVLASPPLLAAGFVHGYGWDYLLTAWCASVAAHVTIAIADIQDGNLPHTHTWTVLSATLLASAVKVSFIASYPDPFNLADPNSAFSAYVDAISAGLVDSINADATTGPIVPLGVVHSHSLL